MDVEGDAVMGDTILPGGEVREVGHLVVGTFRKLPETVAARTVFLGEEDRAVALLNEENMFDDLHGFAFWLLGREGSGVAGGTKVMYRTVEAGGDAGRTMGLAKLHDGGIEGAGILGRDEVVRPGPELVSGLRGVDGGPMVEEPGEDARNVGVHNGGGAVEGKGCDRACGVAANAGEGCEKDGIGGKPAVVFGEDHAGGLLQVAHAVVVAEPFPLAEEFCFGGGGEGGEVREGGEKAFEASVLQNCGNGGLLEHDLGNEDGVGIGGAAPGVVPSLLMEPPEDGAAKGADISQRSSLGHRLVHGNNFGHCTSEVEPRK